MLSTRGALEEAFYFAKVAGVNILSLVGSHPGYARHARHSHLEVDHRVVVLHCRLRLEKQFLEQKYKFNFMTPAF